MTQIATSILASVAVLITAGVADTGENPDLKQVESALRPALEKLDLRADIAHPSTTNSLVVSYRPQLYKIHSRSMTGEISKEAHDETGPSFNGFVLKVHLQDKGEANQAETPQTIHEPYWQTYLDVTPIGGTQKQIYWALSYGSRTDTKLLAQIRKALNDFDLCATPAGVVSNLIREISALATKHTELADFPEYAKRLEEQSQVEFEKDIMPFAISFDKNTTPVLTKRRISPSDCGTNGIYLLFALDDGTNERQAPADTVTYFPHLKLTLYAEVVLWEKAAPELKKKLEDIVAGHKAMLLELDKATANKPEAGDD